MNWYTLTFWSAQNQWVIWNNGAIVERFRAKKLSTAQARLAKYVEQTI
jgi:hypothetical protein